MENPKTNMDELRADMQEFMQEEGFVETVRDDLNERIENCGVQFGKYAMMRKEFLEENDWSKYFRLVASGDFIEHFQDIDTRASELYSQLFDSYLEKYKNEDVARSALEEYLIKEIVEDDSFKEDVFNRPEIELTEEEIANLPF